MSRHIVDDEQRRYCLATPMRLGCNADPVPFGFRRIWVRAAAQPQGHLRRWRSSTMYTDIACVAPPCICPRQDRRRQDGARNAAPPNSRTGS